MGQARADYDVAMTRHDFIGRWALHLPKEYREAFIAELAQFLTREQARERRRLRTDTALYQKACEETGEQIWHYVARTSSSYEEKDLTRLRPLTYRGRPEGRLPVRAAI